MKFNHLNVPDSWKHYWTRYPEGYTILEALISWVSQVDDMVDNQNKLNGTVAQFRNEIDVFVERFDERLQNEVTTTLTDWQSSGFLDVVISEALQWQLDDHITQFQQLEGLLLDDFANDGVVDVEALKNEIVETPYKSLTAHPNQTFVFNDTLEVVKNNFDFYLPKNTKIVATFHDKNVINAIGNNLNISVTIDSPATVNPQANGVFWEYAVIKVTGEKTTIDNCVLNGVPRVGVGLVGGSNHVVTNNTIIGTLTADTATTGHFGVTHDPGVNSTNITIANNIISNVKEGIFLGNWGAGFGKAYTVNNNFFEECFDHGVYVGNQIEGATLFENTFKNCVSPIAISGKNHIVSKNKMYTEGESVVTTFHQAISGRDNVNCIIIENIIDIEISNNSQCIALTQLNGKVVKGNKIKNNVVSTGSNPTIGIQISNGAIGSGYLFENNEIEANSIYSNPRENYGMISMMGSSVADKGKNNSIKQNKLYTTKPHTRSYGLYVLHAKNYSIKENHLYLNGSFEVSTIFTGFQLSNIDSAQVIANNILCDEYGLNATMYGIVEATGTKNRYEKNRILLTSPLLTAVYPLTTTGEQLSNQLSDDSLTGTVVIASAAGNVTLTNKNITTKSFIMLTPLNAEASKKSAWCELYNGEAIIRTGDGTVTSTEARFKFVIV